MVDSVERKIFFYKLELKQNENSVQVLPIFEYLNNLPFSEDGRYLVAEDENIRSIYIDSSNYPIKAKLGTKRRNDLPMVEINGTTDYLTIPDGGGLLEPIHFVIFPENIIGIEFNFYGPRPTSIKQYLINKADTFVDDVTLTPIIRHDLNQMIERVGEVRVFSFKAHRDLTDRIGQLNESLASAFKALKKTSDAKYFEIVLRNQSHSRVAVKIPFFHSLVNWLDDLSVRAGVEKCSIRATDLVTNEIREFDLLKEYIYSTKNVVKHDSIHRSIDSNSMYNGIISSYKELLPEIREIIQLL